jgi:hypothetical protein
MLVPVFYTARRAVFGLDEYCALSVQCRILKACHRDSLITSDANSPSSPKIWLQDKFPAVFDATFVVQLDRCFLTRGAGDEHACPRPGHACCPRIEVQAREGPPEST